MVDPSGPPIKIECIDQDSQTTMDIHNYQRLEKQNIVSLKNQIL